MNQKQAVWQILAAQVLAAQWLISAIGTTFAAEPKPKHPPNALAKETSPYLLQHAHNPVRWRPWGEEALAAAKKENKPIFLSIGYSSCYWCHVMERESFLDEEIAKVLNEHFICIKVDREERPDVDEVYMIAILALSGHGGWPLSVFMTPDGKPFYGGTYFPPRDRDRQPGFLTVARFLQEKWKSDRDTVNKAADALANAVRENLQAPPVLAPPKLRAEMLAATQRAIASQYDAVNTGFRSGISKFPNPALLHFLLYQAQRGDAEARKMFVDTLRRMARGGLRDHIGGGFHRYTVDAQWKIPHFEKMLYDNAQLASLYAEAFMLAKEDEFRDVARQTLDFVLREMTDAGGGFYAALDAETDAVEGAFYVWTREQVQKTLAEEYPLFAAVYGIDRDPNFEHKFYVPQISREVDDVAKEWKLSREDMAQRLAAARAKLFAERAKRKRPRTDVKILAGWNGLMIRGFADAGRLLNEPRYTHAAVRAAEFVLAHLRRDGRLLRTHTSGQAKLNAYQEDYALLIDGLIGLHLATGDHHWLKVSGDLQEKQLELFWDDRHGGFFFTSKDHEQLFAPRRKDAFDGPIPAGNSVAADNLVYLAKALKKTDYRDKAEATLRLFASRLEGAPGAGPAARAARALALWLPSEGTPSAK